MGAPFSSPGYLLGCLIVEAVECSIPIAIPKATEVRPVNPLRRTERESGSFAIINLMNILGCGSGVDYSLCIGLSPCGSEVRRDREARKLATTGI